MLDISLSNEFYKKIFVTYKPNYIFCPKSKNHLFNDCQRKIVISNYNILRSKFSHDKKLNFKNFLLIPTSGTTHSPKLVRLSEVNLRDNIKKIVDYLKINKKK